MQAVATHSAAPAVTIYNGIPTVLSTNIADVLANVTIMSFVISSPS